MKYVLCLCWAISLFCVSNVKSVERWDWKSITNVSGERYHELARINKDADYRVDFRLAITSGKQFFLFYVENSGTNSLVIPKETSGGNYVLYYDGSGNRFTSRLASYLDSGREVPGHESYFWLRSVGMKAPPLLRVSGGLARLQWRCMSKWSAPIWIMFPDRHGRVEHVHSISKEEKIHLVLSAVHSDEGLEKISCVFINQTDQEVSLDNIEGSRHIRLYFVDREDEYILPLDEYIKPETRVEAEAHAIWYLPWESIMHAVQDADVEGSPETGVRIDLTWHLGSHESQPLPLAIMP